MACRKFVLPYASRCQGKIGGTVAPHRQEASEGVFRVEIALVDNCKGHTITAGQ